jgi:hypothetical protein
MRYKIFLILSFFVVLSACESDLTDYSPNKIRINNSNKNITTRNNETNLVAQMGEKFTHPFSIQNATTAHNLVYSSSVKELPVTHLYVRFIPVTLKEQKRLDEDERFVLSNLPFVREVIIEGKYYREGDWNKTLGLEKYAVVDVNESLQGYNYEVLDNLHYDVQDLVLTYTAIDNVMRSPGDPCEPGAISWPECQCDELFTFGSEAWRDCVLSFLLDETEPPAGNNPFEGDPDQSCGCDAPESANQPAGCVTYLDSQLGVQPVKNVRVEGITFYGFSFYTYTDDQGCWDTNLRIFRTRNRLNVKVKFNNEKVAVRSFRMLQLFNFGPFLPALNELVAIVTDPAQIEDGPFNNIQIQYNNNEDEFANMTLYYFAAQALNSMEEYHKYADQYNLEKPMKDGILSDDIDVLISNLAGGAAAPLIDEIGTGFLGPLNDEVLVQATSRALLNIELQNLMGFTFEIPVIGEIVVDPINEGQIIANLFELIAPIIEFYGPDMVYNYGDNINDQTDDIKEVMYHEYGHIAHFKALPTFTKDQYWIDNIERTIDIVVTDLNDDGLLNESAVQLPYGDLTIAGAEQTAIMESFAFYIGYFFTDRKYGVNHSNGGIDPTRNRWLYLDIEQFSPLTTINEPWIPEGLYWDLIDNNANNPALVTDGINNDNVSGFTLRDAELMVTQGTPTTFQEVENTALSLIPAGQNANDVSLIFNEYGY